MPELQVRKQPRARESPRVLKVSVSSGVTVGSGGLSRFTLNGDQWNIENRFGAIGATVKVDARV
jgi:hypothetical protein